MKQWLEAGAAGDRGLSAAAYGSFRAFRLVANLIGTAFIASLDVRALVLVCTVEVLGLMELPLAAFDRFLRRRAKARLRWLQALPLAGIALSAAVMAREATLSSDAATLIEGVGRAAPLLAADPAALGWHALGFAFLASPANHLVRCFVGKSPDGQLAYSVYWGRRAKNAATGVPAGSLADPGSATLAPAVSAAPQPALAAAPAATEAAAAADIHDGAAENAALRAGRAIGTLERWIMVLLILVGQYGLIGLVLTAKSIARFKKIEQDPEFAEYYLLGTLYSTLIALLCGMVLTRV